MSLTPGCPKHFQRENLVAELRILCLNSYDFLIFLPFGTGKNYMRNWTGHP